jgi:hypothetical protein
VRESTKREERDDAELEETALAYKLTGMSGE